MNPTNNSTYPFFQILLILLTIVLTTTALKAEINMKIPDGVEVVAAPQVKEMMEQGSYLLINSLSDIEFDIQHIPGSINIPVDDTLNSKTHHPLFPKDKSSPLIFYCMGDVCPYSRIASKHAVKMGYNKVYWFRGGIMQWRKYQYPVVQDNKVIKLRIKKLAPDNFIEKQQEENAFLLDVRPKWFSHEIDEIFSQGYINGTDAIIPLVDLKARLNELPKDRPILIADGKMLQSINAGKYLKAQGFNVIGVLKGGLARWNTEGMPIVEIPQQ